MPGSVYSPNAGRHDAVDREACPLNVGDTCYEGFEIQGECQNSYCDIFGQPSICVAKKELEASCSTSEECESNFCENGLCATGAFCDGE